MMRETRAGGASRRTDTDSALLPPVGLRPVVPLLAGLSQAGRGPVGPRISDLPSARVEVCTPCRTLTPGDGMASPGGR